MKNKYLQTMITIFFLIILAISCKDELIVESKKENIQTSQSILAKDNISTSFVSDSLSKKEKITKLKKEHEKPYVVIDKPEELLAEKLKSRSTNKFLSKSSNSFSSNSAQSTQSCSTIEIDVWALVKYYPIAGKIVGIWPKQDNNWAYNQNILTSLKDTYAYSKILLERGAIYSNTVYNSHDILAGAPAYDLGLINSYSDYDTTISGSFWGFYTDEPINGDNTLDLNTTLQNMYYTKSWWKQKFGQNSYLIVGETNQDDAQNFEWLSDFLTCTRYTRYRWGIADQRGLWDQFNNLFNNKFNHIWISGNLDYDEFDALIGYAKVMPKSSIWLFAPLVSGGSDWNVITRYSYYSFVHNYLHREEKRFIYIWSYVGNGDPCYDNQDTSWEITDIIETNDTRIL